MAADNGGEGMNKELKTLVFRIVCGGAAKQTFLQNERWPSLGSLDEAKAAIAALDGSSEEARIANEVEANQKRIKKDLEKKHVLRRKVFLFTPVG
ncbi:hypothetical protein Tco_1079319 [Tanacetum coccineum]|uniref:Uncharacterized protein n=1 Tax=Tanacetum coccineum TaxID=301880 RepID=A0ABQ5HRP9_9ASTR